MGRFYVAAVGSLRSAPSYGRDAWSERCANFTRKRGFAAHVERLTGIYYAVDDLPRPISDFTMRRIQDTLEDSAPRSVLTIPPRIWLE